MQDDLGASAFARPKTREDDCTAQATILRKPLDPSIQVDDSLYPTDVIWHFGVDAELATLATAFPETGDTEDSPPVTYRAEKWPT